MKVQADRSVVEAQATLRKALERQWRAWSALITELEAEVQAADRAKDPEAALFDAPPAPKANLPLATRKQLLAAFDARLQTAQAEADAEARRTGTPPPDAEVVRRRLVAHIGRELRGEINEKGLALIYWQHKLVPFDHRALQRSTTKSDYLAAGFGKKGAGPMQTAALIAGGVGTILTLLYVLFSFVLFPSRPTATQRVPEAQVGDATVERWDVRAAGGIDGVALRVNANRVSYPLVLCAPEGQASRLAGGTIIITGTESVRRYSVGETGGDLRIVACENSQTELARGTIAAGFAALPGDAGRVRDVWVRGPANDPEAIPADRMEVTLLVDPSMSEATLVLADGTALSPSKRTPGDAGLELVYLAPLSQVTQAAGLHEQVPGGLPRVSPVALPAPESRLTFLASALAVTDQRVERDGAMLRLTLTLAARTPRGEALALQQGDLAVMAGSRAITPQWTPLALPGDGSPRQLIIDVPATDDALTVVLGTWQASLAP